MNKSGLLFGALALFGSMGALAEPDGPAPALVVSELGCGLLDGDKNFYVALDADVKAVLSNNGRGGNVTYKCTASGVPNPSGQAVKWTYDDLLAPCNTLLGPTDAWRIVIDADGEAVLTCKINPGWVEEDDG